MTQHLKISTLFLLLVGLSFPALAQKRTFEDVFEVRLQNIGPIYQGNQVKGYFMFYFIDRTDDFYKSNFKLIILDEDLNKISEQKLVEQNDTDVLEIGFNGSSLMVELYSPKWREITVRHYDIKLKTLDEKVYGISALKAYQGKTGSIIPIEQKGFVYFYADEKYYMEFFPVKGVKGWKYKTKDFDIIRSKYLAHSDKIILNTVTKKWVKRGAPRVSYLQGVDLEKGKMMFETELPIADYDPNPIHTYRDSSGNFIVSGYYISFNDKGAMGRDRCLGFFTVKISESGQILSQTTIPLDKASTADIKIDDKGRVNGGSDLDIRNATHTSDGSTYLMGDLNTFSGEFYINGILVFKIAPDGQTVQAQRFEVPKLETIQYFNRYVSLSDDATEFSYLFKTVETKGKNETKRIIVESSHAGSADYTQDKITLNADADFSMVLPGKFGHVFLLDYFKKDKKIDMRVEKFNR